MERTERNEQFQRDRKEPHFVGEPMVDLEKAAKTEPTQGIRLLTLRQVAEALQCSERTVWGWTQAGELQVICLGRSRRYRPEDMQDFIIKHRGTGITQRNS